LNVFVEVFTVNNDKNKQAGKRVAASYPFVEGEIFFGWRCLFQTHLAFFSPFPLFIRKESFLS